MTTSPPTVGHPPDRMEPFYRIVRFVASFWLWFFFRAVDVRHPERVPAGGPVLLCINHPNNLIDSLIVGRAVARKVHYLATAALFRNALVARFLAACGAIPIYRRQDDPDKMDRNVETFRACFDAFDAGRLVAIYPEGTTHAETRVRRIKTGAARLALGYEARRPGALTVVPVGLTFESRKAFRGRVLVSFGPPLALAPYRGAYREDDAKAVDALTRDLQWALEAEVVAAERIDDAALVRAVEELYRDVLAREVTEARGLAPREVDLPRLSRAIVDAVSHFRQREPERVEALWQRIRTYRSLLAQHRLRDETVRAQLQRLPVRRRLVLTWDAVVGLPLLLYGALVNALPYYLPRWLARGMARKETDYATIRLLAAVVAYPLFWGLETWAVARLAGWGWAGLFALSLPLTGLAAYRYLIGVGILRSRLRFAALALRHEAAARRLVTERATILAELERAKNDFLTATRGSSF
jgi:1-acyl-sn-glycerol-3-phosphate acyltransferase